MADALFPHALCALCAAEVRDERGVVVFFFHDPSSQAVVRRAADGATSASRVCFTPSGHPCVAMYSTHTCITVTPVLYADSLQLE